MTITLTENDNEVIINGTSITLQMVYIISDWMNRNPDNEETIEGYMAAFAHLQDLATLSIESYEGESLAEIHKSLSLIAQFKLSLRAFFYKKNCLNLD